MRALWRVSLLKLKLTNDRQSVDQSVWFLFSVWHCGFLAVGRPLWWEDVFVIYSYNCFWALPEQSLWGPSPAKLRPYFTVSFETPPTWSKVKVTLRPTVSRPVRLGVRRPFGTRDQFFFLLEIVFRQLRVCYFVAPPLTRRRVCNLLLLLVLTSAVPLGSALSVERSGLYFVGPGPRIYIPKSKSKSHYDLQSVGQSVLVSGAHLRPATNFSFSWRFSFKQLRFVIL
jgi:hypothetical protein